jgi:hypothetical protein
MTATFSPFPTISTATVPAAEDRPSLPGLPPLPAAGMAAISAPPVLPTMPSKASLFSSRPSAPSVEETESSRTVAPVLPVEDSPDFTDEDLAAVLVPAMEQSLQQTLHQSGSCMDTHWEPWLRSTIRRALAEQRSLQDAVEEPGLFQRFCWRIGAFFRDRSYEQMLWENTKRFRVEEVYLLERGSGALLSHAGIDEPGASPSKRMAEKARHLAESLYDAEGTIRLQFRQPRGRKAEVRVGRHAVLIAVVLGEFPEALRVDLDYCLRRVEERFGARFCDRDESLARVVQTYLEECLLIAMPVVGN